MPSFRNRPRTTISTLSAPYSTSVAGSGRMYFAGVPVSAAAFAQMQIQKPREIDCSPQAPRAGGAPPAGAPACHVPPPHAPRSAAARGGQGRRRPRPAQASAESVEGAPADDVARAIGSLRCAATEAAAAAAVACRRLAGGPRASNAPCRRPGATSAGYLDAAHRSSHPRPTVQTACRPVVTEHGRQRVRRESTSEQRSAVLSPNRQARRPFGRLRLASQEGRK